MIIFIFILIYFFFIILLLPSVWLQFSFLFSFIQLSLTQRFDLTVFYVIVEFGKTIFRVRSVSNEIEKKRKNKKEVT